MGALSVSVNVGVYVSLVADVCTAASKPLKENVPKDSGPKVGEGEGDDVDDSHFRSMKSALSGMMKKLETHIQKTESALGDKLQRLDKDRDGVLNAEELAQAVMLVLKNHSSEEVEELFRTLDKDNDGKGV